MKKSKILVTGGAGFIGSHLVDKLLLLENKVTVIDNLSSGNIDNLKGKDIDFIEKDIRDDLPKITGFDFVFHLAAISNVFGKPEDIFSVNVKGFENVLRWCSKKVIYASSCAAINPVSIYGYSKFINELNRGYGDVGLRFFNVYGERQNPDSEYSAVIPKFLSKIKKGESLTVYGDGNQTRDFIHVSDVVDSLIFATQAQLSIHNVGTGISTSVNELIEIMKKVTGKEIKVNYEPSRSGEIIHSKCDKPFIKHKVDLETGIKNLLSGWN